MDNIQVLSITDLPPEMMEKIFGYLTFHERLVVSATCKAWHRLAFCPLFCKRLFLHLKTADDLIAKPFAREAFGRCRNVVITCDGIRDDLLELLNDCMAEASLELLKIDTTKNTAKRIVETVLQRIPELDTLHLELQTNNVMSDEAIQIRHPTLRCAILNGQDTVEYAIECSNLIALESNQVHENSVQTIFSLQGQLQRLKLYGLNRERNYNLSNMISTSQWDHLRELCLMYPPQVENIQRLLERMPCLEKLSLHKLLDLFAADEVLGAAKHLSELTLERHRIETTSLNKFLARSSLQSVSLFACRIDFKVPLKSNSIKRLVFEPSMMEEPLPLFPNLKILNFQGALDEIYLTHRLNQTCRNYPELERLSIGIRPGDIGEFEATPEPNIPKPFSLLYKLEKLKVVRINRIDLCRIDWTTCCDSKVECLRLDGCSIDGAGAEQLLQAFQNLRIFHLTHCYLRQPRADLFDIDEACTNGLRSRFPRCRISYYDCHIEALNDRCGGRVAVI